MRAGFFFFLKLFPYLYITRIHKSLDNLDIGTDLTTDLSWCLKKKKKKKKKYPEAYNGENVFLVLTYLFVHDDSLTS